MRREFADCLASLEPDLVGGCSWRNLIPETPLGKPNSTLGDLKMLFRLDGRYKLGGVVTWALMSVSLGLVPSEGKASDLDSDRMLRAHNEVRSVVNVGPVRWSAPLAHSALRWANHLAQDNGCVVKHSGPGENIYWASPLTWSDGRRERQRISEDDVVASWTAERGFYDHGKHTCRQGKICGHYTQLVWRNTTEIGCARSFCANQSQIWVCHYRPFGNVKGRKPY